MAIKRRHKKFMTKKKISDFQPLSFELNGEEFQVKSAIQGGYLLRFVSEADGEDGSKAANALWGFFEYCMEPAEYERFQKVLDDPETLVEIETIGEIVSYLIEEYTGRPTEQPSPSLSGG